MNRTITISTVFEGQQPSFTFGGPGQFLTSLGIDPDVPITDTATDIKTGGAIRPVAYAKFSSSLVTAAPVAIITSPKNTLVYVVLTNGRLISYTSSFGSETLVGTAAGSVCSGAAYYNNYIYLFGTGASANDVSRYGPLSSGPTLVDGVWTGATLGSQTALGTLTYPTTRHSVKYGNHTAHAHVDGKLYFCDFDNFSSTAANRGAGLIHSINTNFSSTEGTANSSSAYNALDLPWGYAPYAIESYGNSLVIAASQTTDTVLNQGKSAIFIWDTTSTSFSRAVAIPDPYTTALKYQNGVLYGWSGNLSGGVRFWRYLGGDSIETLKYIEEGYPPFANAVDSFGNRVVWGAFTTYPDNSASLFAYGSKSDLFPRGLHNIAISSLTATSSNGLVTAIKNAQQSSSAFPKFLIGGTDGTNFNIDKQGTTYQTHYWRSSVFNVGARFRIKQVTMNLGQTVAANMTLVPKLYFDNESSSQTGTTINSTNYSGQVITMRSDNFSGKVEGSINFYLELKFTGTALVTVVPPIVVELEVYDNPLT